MEIILASGSQIRAELLRRAGISFSIVPADIDEAAYKKSWLAENDGVSEFSGLAVELAREKAKCVGRTYPESLVIASDQLLVFEHRIYDKPISKEELKTRLKKMRGRSHFLVTSVVCMQDGKVMFEDHDQAEMEMWDCSDDFITRYIDSIQDNVLATVGGYEMEGEGIRLFHKVSGSYYSILGIPLFPLMSFLREKALV